MKAGAVIVAAGRGVRMGGLDKCALEIAGRSLLAWSVAAMAAATDAVVVVVAPDRLDEWRACAAAEGWPVAVLVAGGATRGDSVRAGFAALRGAGDFDTVAIHDGARPLVLPAHIRACLAGAAESGAAILAAPVTDTIKRVQGGQIAETLDRTALWAAQTPQCFRASLLAAAFDWLCATGAGPFTDEAGMVEAFGQLVRVVPGDPTNIKVTTPGDLHIAAALLRAREEANTA